jgi:hypothetical protein
MQLMTVSRTEPEKIFIVVSASDVDADMPATAGGLQPGYCVEWINSSTASWQGYRVGIVDGVYNRTQGILGKVAGVVDTTIATGAVGRLQVYGPANVRASATMAGDLAVVTWSINATNIGSVTSVSVSDTLGSVAVQGAFVGWTFVQEAAVAVATNAKVQLSLL